MNTKTVDIHEAQINLPLILSSLTADSEIVLTEDNIPIARLIPVVSPSKQRVSGLHAGSVWLSTDFNDPLPEEYWTGNV